jgi:hypothetical protein
VGRPGRRGRARGRARMDALCSHALAGWLPPLPAPPPHVLTPSPARPQVTHDISNLTCADFLRSAGTQTPVIVRFSTVGGARQLLAWGPWLLWGRAVCGSRACAAGWGVGAAGRCCHAGRAVAGAGAVGGGEAGVAVTLRAGVMPPSRDDDSQRDDETAESEGPACLPPPPPPLQPGPRALHHALGACPPAWLWRGRTSTARRWHPRRGQPGRCRRDSPAPPPPQKKDAPPQTHTRALC